MRFFFRFYKQWITMTLVIAAIAGAIRTSMSLPFAGDPSKKAAHLDEPLKTPLKKSVTCRSDYNQDMLLCLRRAEGLGAQAVVLTVVIAQKSRNASLVYIDPKQTLDSSHIQSFIQKAHQDGLAVILKPLLQIGGDSNILRDSIAPKERKQWFKSYKHVMTTLLKWAEGTDGLVLGTELTSMQEDDRWEDIITSMRSMQENLFLSYNINWNALKPIPWLKKLDAIGLSAYFPLCTSQRTPSVENLIACWQNGSQQRIRAYARQYGRPLWFTEIGLTAREGSNVTPWTTPRTKWCPQCQANWFEAAIKVWDKQSGFLGLTWWSLVAEPCIGKMENNAFSYFDDLASGVLLRHNGKKHSLSMPHPGHGC